MSTLNSVKMSALETLTGNTGPVGSLEYEWISGLTGVSNLTLNGQWHKLLTDKGYSGTLNGMQVAAWKAEGFTGDNRNSLEYQFWDNGGTFA